MARKEVSDQVRLQIPVSRALADKVAELAQMVEWSQGRMASILLENSIYDLKRAGDWMSARTRGTSRKLGYLQTGDNAEVRLQVPIKASTAEQIDQLAARLNTSQVKIAALLIDFAIDDSEWIYRMLSSWFGRNILGPLVGKTSEPYESAEKSMDEEPEERNPEKG